MKRYQWFKICLVAIGVLPLREASADSTWDHREPQSAFLFSDTRARRVGDILTVSLNETTGATNTEQRVMKKDTSSSGKVDLAGKTAGIGSGAIATTASADTSSDRSFNGSAQFQSSRQLLDDVPVTVMEVLPNGNLVVEGFRERTVANEKRVIRISGVIRPIDIDISNTISSQAIAGFRVKYEGGGPETRFTSQGWMGKAVNKLWPF